MGVADKFRSISIYTINPDEPLPFRLAIYYEGKHLVYRKKGQCMETPIFNKFVLRRIQRVFVPEDDFASYLDYQAEKAAKEKLLLKGGAQSASQRALNQMALRVRALAETLFSGDDEIALVSSVKEALEISKSTVKAVLGKPYIDAYFSLACKADTLADHGMRVSVLAALLGYQIGFVNPVALEELAAAGLLHDVGQTRFKLSDPFKKDGAAEQDAEILKQHPIASCDMLSAMPFVPQGVVRIIREHHECRDGSGFPAGLSGTKMYGLSKVFAIANTFDNISAPLRSESVAGAYKRAAELMTGELRSKFDPGLLPKAMKFLTRKA